jgi:hypothetical protein
VLVIVGEIGLEEPVQVLADVAVEEGGDALAVLVALVGAAGGVLVEALLLLVAVGVQPKADRVGDRPGDGALQPGPLIALDEGAQRAAEFPVGTLGDGVDRATDGVAPVEGALGPAQHLDAVDEDRPAARVLDAGGVDPVVVGGHAIVDAEVVGQPADAADHRAIQEGLVAQAGGEVGDVLDGDDADGVLHLRGDRGDGDRHVLQVLRPLLRGDDQFLDGVGAVLGLGGPGEQGRGQSRRRP